MRLVAYVNGEFVELDRAVVSVEDRGYQFADGVYDYTKFYGRRGLRLASHLDRLSASCDGMRIAGAPTAPEWEAIIARLCEECGIPDDATHCAALYQQVTRGVAPRYHLFPKPGVTRPSVAFLARARRACTASSRVTSANSPLARLTPA